MLLGALTSNKRTVQFFGGVSKMKAAPLDGDRLLIRCPLTDNKYCCVLGRIEIKADDLDCFFRKLGVERGHELIHPACLRSHPR